MTATDNETSTKQSQSKTGNKKEISPQKRKPEKAGKQTIKPEKKENEVSAVTPDAGNGTIATPVINKKKAEKQTIKSEQEETKAPIVGSNSENGIGSTTERKQEKMVKTINPDENKKKKAPETASDVGNGIKATPKTAGKIIIKPDKKRDRDPDSPIEASPVSEKDKTGNHTINSGSKEKKSPVVTSKTENVTKSTPVKSKTKSSAVTSKTENVTKSTPVKSKAKSKAVRKGRPKVKTKRSPKAYPRNQRNTRKRKKDNTKPKPEEPTNNMAMFRITKKPTRKVKNRIRQIPLVPSIQRRVGVARGPLKYRLQRAESDGRHRQRVQSNRRMNRRRAKVTKRIAFDDYGGNYWERPDVDLFDLSSIECGSYDDKVNIEEKEDTSVQLVEEIPYHEAEADEWGNSVEFYGLEAPQIPTTFTFNPSAPEFIPKEIPKKKPVVFTLAELMKSVKGQELPTMPALKPFIKSK